MLMRDPERPEIAVDVYEAANPLERAHGLLGATEVGEGRGLLLRGRQVHTLGMSFAIDTVHLAADGRILSIATLKPWRFGRLIPGARWILEMDGGAAGRLGLRPGGYLIAER